MDVPIFKSDVPAQTLALDPRGAARALGISPRTLWAYTKSARIPHLRVGRRVIYPVDALRDWMKKATILTATTVTD
ncbi:MAG: Helix-turn-helix domain protein [Phycisphaerales bacterium]|nr:Helix-turn-helix domain protein [Phycisphaerales bacterium]